MSDKDFKVKNKLQVKGITSAGPVVSDASGNLDSTAYIATQYGGTGTSTSPTSGQVLYSSSGTTYAPTTLSTIVTQQTPTDGQTGTKTYVGTTTPSSPATGDIWIDNTGGSYPNTLRWIYNATGGETSVSGLDVNGVTLSYTVGAELVYLNGVLLMRGIDYTATNGTSITGLAGIVSGDVINVFGYPTSIVNGSIPATIVSNKGDLVVATGSSTLTNLVVGSNDQVLVSDSSAATGVAWKSYGAQNVAGKNKIINGDFGIWQRGTSFSTSGSLAYNCDRFLSYMDGNGTATTSQQTFTPGTAPVSGYEGTYFLRQAVTTKGTSTYIQWETRTEDVRTFAGQTATISFWARVNSGTVSPINVQFFQAFGSGGSSAVYTSAQTATLTSSWVRYSFTFTIPSVSGKTIGAGNYLGLDVWLPFSTTTSVDYWGVQLEAGSVATPFTTATGTIQGELAACQRYYYRFAATGTNQYFGSAYARSATNAFALVKMPVTMRTAPTLAFASGASYFNFQIGTGDFTVTTLDGSYYATTDTALVRMTSSGMTAGQGGMALFQNASAYIEMSSEI